VPDAQNSLGRALGHFFLFSSVWFLRMLAMVSATMAILSEISARSRCEM
jgi:hypothetical protein